MNTRIVVQLFNNGELVADSTHDFDVPCSWYTAQNYFNEHVKYELFTGYCDTIKLKWNNKNYEFCRSKELRSKNEK